MLLHAAAREASLLARGWKFTRGVQVAAGAGQRSPTWARGDTCSDLVWLGESDLHNLQSVTGGAAGASRGNVLLKRPTSVDHSGWGACKTMDCVPHWGQSWSATGTVAPAPVRWTRNTTSGRWGHSPHPDSSRAALWGAGGSLLAVHRQGALDPVLFWAARRFYLLSPAGRGQAKAGAAPDAGEKPQTGADHLDLTSKSSESAGVSSSQGTSQEVKPSKAQQLRKVFKEYGAVGVTFHVGISLMSLGIFYLAISSGVNMTALLFKLGFSEAVVQSRMAAGTSTFVLAYAAHKLFAPVRISITLVCVPLLVRHFRKTGLFKPPASSP
ncbi:protein FAM210B, mitochondrial [Amia ocellicauda]|uniref:protein FAM210B, mitochondrial n=1 Tax=Amia ocellicauda TaxID=2972642 RepID=UPI003464B9CC